MMRRASWLLAIVLAISACSYHGSSTAYQPLPIVPQVVQQQGGGPWVTFSIPGTPTFGITAGPDGAVWYCDEGANALRRVDMSGVGTFFSAPDSGFCSSVITGPDGNLYFGETDTTLNESGIARMTPSGTYSF